MLTKIFSRAQAGVDAPAVIVEVHQSNGLPALNIAGLPEAAVRESKDRVRSALINSRFDFPTRKLSAVNLAPADLPKEGGRFDLPVALGILAASSQLAQEPLADMEFLGELSLSGELRPVRGALPAALKARAAGAHRERRRSGPGIRRHGHRRTPSIGCMRPSHRPAAAHAAPIGTRFP